MEAQSTPVHVPVVVYVPIYCPVRRRCAILGLLWCSIDHAVECPPGAATRDTRRVLASAGYA